MILKTDVRMDFAKPHDGRPVSPKSRAWLPRRRLADERALRRDYLAGLRDRILVGNCLRGSDLLRRCRSWIA